MDKVVQDGKVAVLVSRGWGAGWYSWHGIEELLYDPYIVNILLTEPGEVQEKIAVYCEQKYPDAPTGFAGVDGLSVVWINQGTEFLIDEYDGAETIQYRDQTHWLRA